MRLRKIKNAEQRLKDHPDIVIFDFVQWKGKWKDLFQNNNPIYLEIGMGKGKFIIEHATKYPEINFIGLEREESVLVKAIDKLTNPLPNLKIINGDAENINDIFEDNEINKIYLNFSDPWPKNRHTKRRLTNNHNLEKYKHILIKDGSIEFKTDNRHLFEFSLMMFVQEKLEIIDLSLNLHEDKIDIITTEYEDRFVALGNIIYYIEVKNGKNEIV